MARVRPGVCGLEPVSMSAGFHLDLFDYDSHERIAREACEIAQSAGFLPPVISSQIDLLLNWARREEVAQCEMLLPDVVEVAETRARTLIAAGRTHEAIADLQQATALVRSIGDPAVFLRVAASLLAVAGDDALLAETHATLQRLRAALPNSTMQARFEMAEPVRLVARLAGT